MNRNFDNHSQLRKSNTIIYERIADWLNPFNCHFFCIFLMTEDHERSNVVLSCYLSFAHNRCQERICHFTCYFFIWSYHKPKDSCWNCLHSTPDSAVDFIFCTPLSICYTLQPQPIYSEIQYGWLRMELFFIALVARRFFPRKMIKDTHESSW